MAFTRQVVVSISNTTSDTVSTVSRVSGLRVLVDGTVAVRIHAVARIAHHPGVHVRIVVVAVSRCRTRAFVALAAKGWRGGVAPAVAVRVCVDLDQNILVDLVVAVIVDAVAGLLGRGRDSGVRVIAVVAHIDRALRRLAGLHGLAGPVPVAVGVAPPGKEDVLVDFVIAVVIDAVARLGCAGMDGPICIVAVALLFGVPVAVQVEDGGSGVVLRHRLGRPRLAAFIFRTCREECGCKKREYAHGSPGAAVRAYQRPMGTVRCSLVALRSGPPAKSLPLSSTTSKAGKSSTSIFHTASLPSSS